MTNRKQTGLGVVGLLIMKAVVIYKNVEFAERVKAILRRIAARAEVNIQWKVSSLSVDAMNKKNYAGKTLAQARDAHLIVLPAKLARSVPVGLLSWLEHWAELRHNEEMALGILDDSASGSVETRMHPALSKFAHKHGLSVIRDGSLLENKGPSVPAIELNGYRSFGQPGTYRSFGINE
jgi:hypothetical protein